MHINSSQEEGCQKRANTRGLCGQHGGGKRCAFVIGSSDGAGGASATDTAAAAADAAAAAAAGVDATASTTTGRSGNGKGKGQGETCPHLALSPSGFCLRHGGGRRCDAVLMNGEDRGEDPSGSSSSGGNSSTSGNSSASGNIVGHRTCQRAACGTSTKCSRHGGKHLCDMCVCVHPELVLPV